MPTSPRRYRRLYALVSVLFTAVALWLAAGTLVAWRLTRRARPPFEEPAPALVRGTAEAHRLRTGDGVELGAWLHRGEPGRPCALLLHGIGASRTDQRALLTWLAEEGFCVLALSLRAHGDSGGEVVDFGWSARRDVLAGVALLERELPDRPVVLFGSSLGAAAALYAARELGRRPAGYVLESPYRDLRTALHNRLQLALPAGLDRLAFPSMWLAGRFLLPVPPDALSPLAHVTDVPPEVPVLLLAGALDRHARLYEVKALAARRPQSRLEVFPRAAHGGLRASEPERYRALLRAALEGALAR